MNNLIGNTPLIKIYYKINGTTKYIYVKMEQYNLTGSIKDRMVNYVLEKAYKKGVISEGMTVVEATSGNTGISLAALAHKYKLKVHIFMPDWCSQERVKLMKNFGAQVHLISKQQGGFKECVNQSKKLAATTNAFLLNQFSNQDNIMCHYYNTAEEIVNKLNKIDAFTSGIGTGGTIIGISKKLKKINPNTVIYALEPIKMALLSGSNNLSNHKIEGIGDDFIPDLVDMNYIDRINLIDDDDAVNMARLLSKKLGLGVGISSGANFLSAIMINEEIDGNVLTLFPDDNKKYLSTDLSKPLDINHEVLSNNIELLKYEEV